MFDCEGYREVCVVSEKGKGNRGRGDVSLSWWVVAFLVVHV